MIRVYRAVAIVMAAVGLLLTAGCSGDARTTTTGAVAPKGAVTPTESTTIAGGANAPSTTISSGRSLFPAYGSDTHLWGYIDRAGAWVVEPQFALAMPFSEGLAMVNVERRAGTGGFIDENGGWAIRPTLWSAQDFHDGLAAVDLAPDEYGYHSGFVDKTGAWAIEPTGPDPPYFDPPFSEGLCAATDGSGRGFVDKAGNWVIPPRFIDVGRFSQGLAYATNESAGGLLGFIDKTGAWAIRPQYSEVRSFTADGLAAVRVDDGWGYIDTSGTMMIPPEYCKGNCLVRVFSFSEGLVAVPIDGKFGYLDTKGAEVIRPRFDLAEDFSEGLAAASIVVNGTYLTGYIDRTSSPWGSRSRTASRWWAWAGKGRRMRATSTGPGPSSGDPPRLGRSDRLLKSSPRACPEWPATPGGPG
jgi:hypothetical protein